MARDLHKLRPTSVALTVALAVLAGAACGETAGAPASDGADGGPGRSTARKARGPAPAFGDGAQTAGEGAASVSADARALSRLSRDEKALLYHYLEAAAAADAVHLSGQGTDVAAVARLLEGIRAVGARVPAPLNAKIEPYAERFFRLRGVRDPQSGAKIQPSFIPGELAAAAEIAVGRGADIGLGEVGDAKLGASRLEQLEALLKAVRPAIFDPVYEPAVDPAVRTEPLARALGGVNEPLARAAAVAPPAIRPALAALADCLESGKPGRCQDYERGLVGAPGPVAAWFGYLGTGGERPVPRPGFGAIVALCDAAEADLFVRTAAAAARFERRLPFNAMYKRPPRTIVPPAVGACRSIGVGGGAGDAVGETLSLPTRIAPGEQGGRREVLVFLDRLEARGRLVHAPALKEWAFDASSGERLETCRAANAKAWVALREIIGPDVGKPSLGDGAAGFEDLRRDLIALYLAFDPEAASLGLVSEACAPTLYDGYVAGALYEQADRGRMGARGEGRQNAGVLLLKRLVAAGAVEVANKDGRLLAHVVDHKAMRRVVGELLGDVQQIASTGNRQAAAALLAGDQTRAPEAWRRDAKERLARIGVPARIEFVYPKIEARLDEAGSVADIAVVGR